jgi:hypothetical protein
MVPWRMCPPSFPVCISQTFRPQTVHIHTRIQADGALAYVSSLLPSFHEDMSLIEFLDELLETAKKKARTELTRNMEVTRKLWCCVSGAISWVSLCGYRLFVGWVCVDIELSGRRHARSSRTMWRQQGSCGVVCLRLFVGWVCVDIELTGRWHARSSRTMWR